MVKRGPGRTAGLLAALALTAAALAGCGSDDGDDGDTVTDPGTGSESSSATASPSPSATESPSPTESEAPQGPDCTEVWVDGAKLPGGYQDCYAGDQRVKANGRYCEFGKPLVTYADSFWAVPGGPIFEVEGKLLDDAGYRDALRKCSG